ncbi:hypothetical protein BGZ91_001277 [Linnemannia elongata]|nr:hypothetical protein BGZ91_001277 [Linnemannia elongata]
MFFQLNFTSMVYRLRLSPDAKVLANAWVQNGSEWKAEYTAYNQKKYRVKVATVGSAGLPNAATAQVWIENAAIKIGTETWIDSEVTLDNLDTVCVITVTRID